MDASPHGQLASTLQCLLIPKLRAREVLAQFQDKETPQKPQYTDALETFSTCLAGHGPWVRFSSSPCFLKPVLGM